MRGLLVAAPKEPVIAAVHAIERAGLHVARVDVASLALLRAVSRLDGQVEAIVDIGAQATTVVVHVDGEPLIVRTVPRGGADITERDRGPARRQRRRGRVAQVPGRAAHRGGSGDGGGDPRGHPAAARRGPQLVRLRHLGRAADRA